MKAKRMKTSELSDIVDSAAENLMQSLNFDLSDIKSLDDVDVLKLKLKVSYTHYISMSKVLSNKLLLTAGATEESNIERNRRTELHSEYYEAIKSVRLISNNLGGDDQSSTWDVSSVRSTSPFTAIPNAPASTSTNPDLYSSNWQPNQDYSLSNKNIIPPCTAKSVYIPVSTHYTPTYTTSANNPQNETLVTVDSVHSSPIPPEPIPNNFAQNPTNYVASSSFRPITKVHFASNNQTDLLDNSMAHCSLQDNNLFEQPSAAGYRTTPYPQGLPFQKYDRNQNMFLPSNDQQSTHGLSSQRNMGDGNTLHASNRQPYGVHPYVPTPSFRQTSVDHHLRRLELFKPSSHPFAGEPQRFFAWKSLLENELQYVELNSIDTIKVLMANTTGEPLNIIKDLFNAGAANPDMALKNIWKALHQQFGTSTQVASALQKQIEDSPNLKSMSQGKKLRELLHLCHLIQSYMNSCQDLQWYNLPAGIRKIWLKLPDPIQNRWRSVANDFEVRNWGHGPTFLKFTEFLENQVQEACNPNYEKVNYATIDTKKSRSLKTEIQTQKESVILQTEMPLQDFKCPIHKTDHHSLILCRQFQKLQYKDKRSILIDNKLCFRCAMKHNAKDCNIDISCEKCSGKHKTVLHNDDYKPQARNDTATNNTNSEAKNLCTSLCNDALLGKNCSKTVLVELTLPSFSDKKMTTYAILDDQSTTSFVDPKVIQFFGVSGKPYTYTLVTLLGLKSHMEGQIIEGLTIRGIKEKKTYQLPPMISNESIPDTKSEVASPAMVEAHPHLKGLSKYFCNVHQSAEVTLLIGRDCADILPIKCYGNKAPYAYQTNIGWSLVGSACPAKTTPSSSCLKTSVEHEHFIVNPNSSNITNKKPSLLEDVFDERPDDELKSYSEEEKAFNNIMQSSVTINNKGHISMPLPFRDPDPCLPDNMKAVYHRTNNTLQRLKKNSVKLKDCLKIMQTNIDAHYVEEIPADEPMPTDGKAWWLPIFPVVHPKKKKNRLVFDASASFHGTSLNDRLLKGPDENNLLKGVLLRFRKGPVAFSSDVEAMFHQFHVDPKDCNFLRFFWFRENSPENELTQYRALVHIFGNRPSPSIANFGLRHATKLDNAYQYPEAQSFICNNIYVDDGLGSAQTAGEAVKTLKDARTILKTVGVRLHKIASNSPDVLSEFPEADLASQPQSIELGDCTTHGALGVSWNTRTDEFLFSIDVPDKPFTRRGVLSTVNTLFDPLKVAAPIVLTGRLLQRALLAATDNSSWDETLDPALYNEWSDWKKSLSELKDLTLPRSFIPEGFGAPVRCEVHTFCDASNCAIAYVSYLKVINSSNDIHVSFICACSKLAPKGTTSIPRLELCSAVEASIGTSEILRELHLPIDSVKLYSDSTVTLGYIANTTKNFSNYVSRRVTLIKKSFPAEYWQYVPTDINTADIATRPTDTQSLLQSRWLNGPAFLWDHSPAHFIATFPELPEVIESEKVFTSQAKINQQGIFSKLLSKCSEWNKVKRIVQHVMNFIVKLKAKINLNHVDSDTKKVSLNNVENIIISDVQEEYFSDLKTRLTQGECIKDNSLAQLSPFLSEDGIIRVGGRLKHAPISYEQRHPALLPTDSPLSKLLILYHHNKSQHQGRVITSSALRAHGLFIFKGSKKIRSIINECILCRKLRRPTEIQKMSDIPVQRLEDHPPFTYSGLDVCGPFTIAYGKTTRKSSGSQKIWALLITCMVTRGVHIEPLPSLDVTSFKNAYRRFLSVRGHCKKLYSDCGTNFVGAVNTSDDFSFEKFHRELQEQGTEWTMNPPHASHFGGIWERKIGSLKRILNATLSQLGPRLLSHDEFVTLLSEASSIINNTPLTNLQSNPNEPFPITPALLLTQKVISNPPPLETYSEKDILAYGKRRYRRVQHLSDYFWNKWRNEYLSDQIYRKKWLNKCNSLKVGDLVLLKNKNVRRNKWPMGIIRSVKISADKLVRSATIDIVDDNGVRRSYVRPIVDLVLLASHDS